MLQITSYRNIIFFSLPWRSFLSLLSFSSHGFVLWVFFLELDSQSLSSESSLSAKTDWASHYCQHLGPSIVIGWGFSLVSSAGFHFADWVFSLSLSVFQLAGWVFFLCSVFLSLPSLSWTKQWWKGCWISDWLRRKRRKFQLNQDVSPICLRNVPLVSLDTFWQKEIRIKGRWRTQWGRRGRWVRTFKLWMWGIMSCNLNLGLNINWNGWSKMDLGILIIICCCYIDGEEGFQLQT